MIKPADEEAIEQAYQLLSSGEVIAFPTETVYGLGADATNTSAVKKIYELKGRPKNNPLIVHAKSLDSLISLLDPRSPPLILEQIYKLKVFWPGALTVVVPSSDSISMIARAGGTSIGVRIPSHPVAQALLDRCPFPIAAPSANTSNYISPTLARHVEEQLGSKIPLVLDGGPCLIGVESTVLSLLDPKKPKILRPGAISDQQIYNAIGIEPELANTLKVSTESLPSPGLFEKHYSPRTKTDFLARTDLSSLPAIRIGLLAFREGLHLDFDFAAIKVLCPFQDTRIIARKLYSALYELDQLDLDLILVDSCEETGLGIAIMDRLRRAVNVR